MPYLSTAQKNDSLDNAWGPAHGSKGPDGFHMRLFTGGAPAPDGSGVEVTSTNCPGYAPVAFDHGDIPDAVDGVKSISVLFPDPTAEWTVRVDTWVITNEDDPDDIRAYGQPANPLEVTAASSTGPRCTARIYYDPRIILED